MANLDEDLKLKILANEPVFIDSIFVYPVSIGKIAKFGYKEYNQALKILCISNQEIKSIVNEDIPPFEFLRMNMLFDPNITKILCQILSLICKNKVTFSDEKLGFIVGRGILDKNNFDRIVNIIRIENCINNESADENPSNEKARMILEKRRKARNKLIKNNQANTLHIPEIVNIVSVGMNLPISEVMQYSIYQLICEFNRLISKENYETSISALIHGANKNDLDLKHWTEKN